jgi:hypothetical protein
MKTVKMLGIALVVIFAATSIYAKDGHKGHKMSGHEGHKDHKMAGHDMEESAGPKEVQLEGRIIGLTCFLKHKMDPKDHVSCAKMCAEKGLPLGLLTKDGKIYQVTGPGHESLVEVNKPLLKYAEQMVKVKGQAFSTNGVHMIIIEKIKKG